MPGEKTTYSLMPFPTPIESILQCSYLSLQAPNLGNTSCVPYL